MLKLDICPRVEFGYYSGPRIVVMVRFLTRGRGIGSYLHIEYLENNLAVSFTFVRPDALVDTYI